MSVSSINSPSQVGVKTALPNVAIACTITAVWGLSLIALLSTTINQQSLLWLPLAILWQTFLYTGLFITAHDAMHGVVCPRHPKLNYAIGVLILLLYGFLFYPKLIKSHHEHHQNPATHLDPDFHDGKHSSLLLWYLGFMRQHWSLGSTVAIILSYHSIRCFAHVSETNLVLFWAIPPLLSSFQLFYFGTFLPHREPPEGYTNIFHTQSISRPFFWSLITCYHFGYHFEHHQHPDVPWWYLPTIAQSQLE